MATLTVYPYSIMVKDFAMNLEFINHLSTKRNFTLGYFVTTKVNDPTYIASFLNCLSILENDTFRLYKALSDKVEQPLVKSLLFNIAIDSQKHAVLLKGIGDSIAKIEVKPKDCEVKVGEAWRVTKAFYHEIASKEKISKKELHQLVEKLGVLESIAGEEYNIFLQLKTLELMTEEINRLCNINSGNLKRIFESIINDEKHHRELLATIEDLLC